MRMIVLLAVLGVLGGAWAASHYGVMRQSPNLIAVAAAGAAASGTRTGTRVPSTRIGSPGNSRTGGGLFGSSRVK